MSPDPDFEDIAWLAAEIGAAPVALVVLFEGNPPAVRCAARVGAGALAAASVSGCVLALAREGMTLSVPDLHAEARFAGDPALAPPLQARALAAAPIPSAAGESLGSVALFDLEARPFLPWQMRALDRLAALAGRRLEVARESRERDRRREEMLGALAGGLALEIQALQAERISAAPLARAAALARDLLALSGHRSLRPAPVDLNTLVAARAERAADACGRRLELRLDRTIGPVAADGERLGHVIAGLVSRAAGSAGDPAQAMRLRTSEIAIEAGAAAPLPAGRYVLLTIDAPLPGDDDPVRGWSFDGMDLPGLSEMRGLLRQSGARLGTAIGVSGLPAFCIALPRAAD